MDDNTTNIKTTLILITVCQSVNVPARLKGALRPKGALSLISGLKLQYRFDDRAFMAVVQRYLHVLEIVELIQLIDR